MLNREDELDDTDEMVEFELGDLGDKLTVSLGLFPFDLFANLIFFGSSLNFLPLLRSFDELNSCFTLLFLVWSDRLFERSSGASAPAAAALSSLTFLDIGVGLLKLIGFISIDSLIGVDVRPPVPTPFKLLASNGFCNKATNCNGFRFCANGMNGKLLLTAFVFVFGVVDEGHEVLNKFRNKFKTFC